MMSFVTMKKISVGLLMSLYLLPCFASPLEGYDEDSNTLQEWCAKEEDPVQRLHYCNLLEKNAQGKRATKNFNTQVATV